MALPDVAWKYSAGIIQVEVVMGVTGLTAVPEMAPAGRVVTQLTGRVDVPEMTKPRYSKLSRTPLFVYAGDATALVR